MKNKKCNTEIEVWVKLWKEEGIQKWISNKCRGTLQWATGVGKTRASMLAITKFLNKNPGKKVVIIVPSDYLKELETLLYEGVLNIN